LPSSCGERYNDSEFRATFSTLIGHEIDQIDFLVNQLLRFARPAKPSPCPRYPGEVSSPRGAPPLPEIIKLTRNCGANIDTIRADSDQLEQVFLNLCHGRDEKRRRAPARSF
jgi:nitrogen-specific signal transduction histidine kinase